MYSLNTFLLLVGMADTAASTLLQWETTHFSEDAVNHTTGVLVCKSESGTVRLV